MVGFDASLLRAAGRPRTHRGDDRDATSPFGPSAGKIERSGRTVARFPPLKAVGHGLKKSAVFGARVTFCFIAP